jgi:hypothetical protein
MLFGRKIDPVPSTIRGTRVSEPTGMPYNRDPGGPWIPADATPRHALTIGVLSTVVLDGDAGISEFERARAATQDALATSERALREPTLDERLRRLGIRPRRAR